MYLTTLAWKRRPRKWAWNRDPAECAPERAETGAKTGRSGAGARNGLRLRSWVVFRTYGEAPALTLPDLSPDPFARFSPDFRPIFARFSPEHLKCRKSNFPSWIKKETEDFLRWAAEAYHAEPSRWGPQRSIRPISTRFSPDFRPTAWNPFAGFSPDFHPNFTRFSPAQVLDRHASASHRSTPRPATPRYARTSARSAFEFLRNSCVRGEERAG